MILDYNCLSFKVLLDHSLSIVKIEKNNLAGCEIGFKLYWILQRCGKKFTMRPYSGEKK